MLTEVEGTQQDIETQQVGKDKPHILGQPQMIGIHRLRQQISRSVRRSHLIGRHTTEEGIRPSATLTGLLQIFDTFLSGASSCRRVMAIEDTSFDIGGKEISKGQNGKQQHCQHVGQAFLQ